MSEQKRQEEYSFYDLFVPLTIKKAIFIIFLIGFIVYFNMLFNNFVWDDKTYILFNPDVVTFNLLGLIRNNIFNAGGQYRPVPGIYFSVLFAFFKYNTFFYHFLQLIIHVINASMLFILFTKFFKKNISLVLSLIFLIHPIQVESVSYISAADNTPFFLFGFSALWIIFQKAISLKKIGIITLLLLLSLLTKESGVLFIFIILLYIFLFNRKLLLHFFISVCIAFGLYLFIRFVIGGVFFSTLPLIPIARLSFIDRLINIPTILFYYIKTFFFPFHLAIDQQWVIHTITFQTFYLPLLLDVLFLFLIAIMGIFTYRNKSNLFKPYLFFTLWFLGGMSVYMQFFPLDGTVADRWFYFPIVGLLGLIGIGLQLIASHYKYIKIWGYSVLLVILVLLSLRTIMRNVNWYDPITLYTHDIQLSDNFDIESNLGIEYSTVRDYKNAIKHSAKSVELFPYEVNLYNLANTYEQIGDISHAKKYYSEALKYPNYLPINHRHIQYTYIRLAYMMYLTKDFKNAASISKLGLEDYPTSPYLWIELAASEYKLGDQLNALQSAKKAKALLPTTAMVYLYTEIADKKSLSLKL